jgi:hypothetical protein
MQSGMEYEIISSPSMHILPDLAARSGFIAYSSDKNTFEIDEILTQQELDLLSQMNYSRISIYRRVHSSHHCLGVGLQNQLANQQILVRLIRQVTVFFSHSKITSASLSAVKTTTLSRQMFDTN